MSTSLYWTGRFLSKNLLKPNITVELSRHDSELVKKALRITHGNLFVYDEEVSKVGLDVLIIDVGNHGHRDTAYICHRNSACIHPIYFRITSKGSKSHHILLIKQFTWETPVRNLVVASCFPPTTESTYFYLHKLSDFGGKHKENYFNIPVKQMQPIVSENSNPISKDDPLFREWNQKSAQYAKQTKR
jgi:hypothetical protein